MGLPNIDPLGLEPLAPETIGVWGGPVKDRIDKNSARSNDHETRIATNEQAILNLPAPFTPEAAQDAVASLIAAGTHVGITVTYDDVNNRLSFSVTNPVIPGTSAPTNLNALWADTN